MKKIAIVGAGVSGMSAAIYCLRSGFDVTIYEKQPASGGLCTSWKRMGYTFEGAVHWLTDSDEQAPLYRLWRDTGILGEGVKTYRSDPFVVFSSGGCEMRLHRDLEKLKAHLLEIAPEDSRAVKRLCSDIRALYYMLIPVVDIKGVRSKNKSRLDISMLPGILPGLMRMGRFSGVTAAQYATAFKNPAIRKALGEFVVYSEFGCASLLITLATLMRGGVFPEGGSLGIASRMENAVKSLGGTILFNSKVDKVIVENGIALGLETDGTQTPYDGVIVTADTITAQKLFDKPPKDRWIKKLKNAPPVQCTFAGIGVRTDLRELPSFFAIEEPVRAGGVTFDTVPLDNYAEHPAYAPIGCTALTASWTCDSYDFWQNHKQKGTYDEQKQVLADDIKRILEKHLPQTRGKIDVVNIATPLTYERYTGSYRGAWMTVLGKKNRFSMPAPVSAEIKNLYFAGFRTITPGGLPVALYSGFRAAQYLCKDSNVIFEGAVP